MRAHPAGPRSGELHTDLPRLRRGGVGAQLWSAFVPSTLPRHEAVTMTLEQIDAIRRMVRRYPDDLVLATSADDMEAARTAGIKPLLFRGGNLLDFVRANIFEPRLAS